MASTPTNNFDFQNFYSGQLTADITSGSLTLSLDTVPTPSEGILVVEPDSTSNREIIYYTSKGVNTITCPSDGRGWDGTTATSHLTGSTVIMAPVAYMLRMLKSGSLFDTTKTGWTTVGQTLTYSANNGQKEFVLNTPVDLTSTLSVGNKLKFDRITTPPTQAMSFSSASSQYATKASPSGITFTGAFTCEAWVYLNSYTGNNQYIINRFDSGGTSGGWGLRVNSSGQVDIFYGSGSTFTEFATYQSLPLSRWVHISAVITSVSSKTAAIYLNGTSVPISTVASAATALAQDAVDLRIGALAGGTITNSYLNGYLSEVRVWSTNQSQANIQSNMAISLSGSETNLVALFQGNGNFNDKTTNGNNLTPSGGAIATQASNPYHTTEFGIITAISSTQLTLFMGTDYVVPNGTLTNFYYSTARAPAGFPASRGKWLVDVLLLSGPTQATPTANTWYNVGSTQISVPTGEWTLGYAGDYGSDRSAGGALTTQITLGTSSSTPTDVRYSTEANIQGGTVATVPATIFNPETVTSQTLYYLLMRSIQSSTNNLYLSSTRARFIIRAECAYL